MLIEKIKEEHKYLLGYEKIKKIAEDFCDDVIKKWGWNEVYMCNYGDRIIITNMKDMASSILEWEIGKSKYSVRFLMWISEKCGYRYEEYDEEQIKPEIPLPILAVVNVLQDKGFSPVGMCIKKEPDPYTNEEWKKYELYLRKPLKDEVSVWIHFWWNKKIEASE